MTTPIGGSLGFAQDTVPTVGTTALRDARYASPPTGFKVYNVEVAAFQRYTGSAWVTDSTYVVNASLYGYLPSASAAANGVALQAAIDATPDHGVLLIPPGSYVQSGTPTLQARADLVIVGDGVQITLSGTNSFGLKFLGANTDITVRGFRVTGDGVAASNQQGFGTTVAPASGQANQRILFDDVRCASVARGIYFDVGTVYEAKDIVYRNCYATSIVGTTSGSGYGLTCSGVDGVLIEGAVTDLTQRHAIYVSVCRHFQVVAPRCARHRQGVSDDSQTPALSIARSRDGVVLAPVFEACEDAAMEIRPDETATAGTSQGITVVSPVFRNSTHRDLYIGNASPSTSDILQDVTILNPVFIASSSATNAREMVRLQSGINIKILDPILDLDRSYTVTKVGIYLVGNDSAAYTNHVQIVRPRITASKASSGEVYGIMLGGLLCTGSSQISVSDLDMSSGAGLYPVAYATTRTSTTLAFRGMQDPLGSDVVGPAYPFIGGVALTGIGAGLEVTTGTNARLGTATLVAGSVVVANTSVTANTKVFLTRATTGGTPGHLSYTVSAGVSFTITATGGSDTSTVNWFLVEGIP